MYNPLKWITAGALTLFATHGYTQHSDIVFDVDDNQLVIEAEGHDHGEGGEDHSGGLMTGNGKWLFESDFGDFAQGPDSTDDPGFASHETSGVLTPGTIIGFEGFGSLQYWDGMSWTIADDESLSIEDAFGATTTFSGAGVSNGSTTYIDAADSAGGFHAHVPYTINAGADTGAYLIEMSLLGLDGSDYSQRYDPSESVYIAFNYGLDEATFEQGVDAFAAVPVPGAAALMFSALSALGVVGVRRRRHI